MRMRSHNFGNKASGKIGTISLYGPDDQRASKVAVAIVNQADNSVIEMRRWSVSAGDIRHNSRITAEITAYLKARRVKQSVMTERIIGCPHEEGVDYPKGERCPQCPFWATRDRWTGDFEH